jgi:hypothetical protein
VFSALVLEPLPFIYLFGTAAKETGMLPMTILDQVRGTSEISVPTFRVDALAQLVSFDRVDVLSTDQVDAERVLASCDIDELGVTILDLWKPSSSTLEALADKFTVVAQFEHSVVLKRK